MITMRRRRRWRWRRVGAARRWQMQRLWHQLEWTRPKLQQLWVPRRWRVEPLLASNGSRISIRKGLPSETHSLTCFLDSFISIALVNNTWCSSKVKCFACFLNYYSNYALVFLSSTTVQINLLFLYIFHLLIEKCWMLIML